MEKLAIRTPLPLRTERYSNPRHEHYRLRVKITSPPENKPRQVDEEGNICSTYLLHCRRLFKTGLF